MYAANKPPSDPRKEILQPNGVVKVWFTERLRCRDADVIDLSERLDYVEQTGDGSLDDWY